MDTVQVSYGQYIFSPNPGGSDGEEPPHRRDRTPARAAGNG